MVHSLLVILAVWFVGSIPLGLIMGRLLASRSQAEEAYWNAQYRAPASGISRSMPVIRPEALNSGAVNPVTYTPSDEIDHLQ